MISWYADVPAIVRTNLAYFMTIISSNCDPESMGLLQRALLAVPMKGVTRGPRVFVEHTQGASSD